MTRLSLFNAVGITTTEGTIHTLSAPTILGTATFSGRKLRISPTQNLS